jgi:hypothetical protein
LTRSFHFLFLGEEEVVADPDPSVDAASNGVAVECGEANCWPQSQTMRRAGICRRHLGHTLNHVFLTTGFATAGAAAFWAARVVASARVTAHWGCIPPREYDGLWQTGQTAVALTERIGPGFRSLKVSLSDLELNRARV